VRRGLPGREVVCVADRRCAALAWLALVAHWPGVRVSTRLRRDAALDAPPPPRAPGQRGRPRLTGQRRPTVAAVWVDAQTPWRKRTLDDWSGEGPREVEVATDTASWSHAGPPPVASRGVLMRDPPEPCKPHALWATQLEHTPAQRLPWCVRRWTMEVTWEEVRAHLGMATQRQWNERAIARATPARVSLYSIMTLTAQLLIEPGAPGVRRTAWYSKTRPTFSDAIALVRRQLWEHIPFSPSQQETDMIQIPRTLLERFTEALCYAASLDKVELRGYPKTCLGEKVDVLDS
jgi:hypothetical protein